ncbi:uncharacterized protein LOC129179564 isoform X2 [Dunckerocampus dactyliophorus]|uniref:uncharacterized protein LOC129179564 isoform X2 n=1 Tax=Dunckerocampus dactyliophorus TaxID=161453 RepID=UPI00240498DB|nr:uncharacterized protein LOC129179564 isoform X2 [Dunckerocampus dactyliophorus]
MLKELVKERLMAAADEIFALLERTMASYEEELSRTREENERQRQQLEAVYKTQFVLQIEGAQQVIGHQEEHPPQPQQDPQTPHVKEEAEEVWPTQEGECLLRRPAGDWSSRRTSPSAAARSPDPPRERGSGGSLAHSGGRVPSQVRSDGHVCEDGRPRRPTASKQPLSSAVR